jgi:DNA-directed RNA polymerase specialized sigma24 family protein
VDGFSYQEMREIADASESALKMRVHRAREALRAHLGGLGADQDVTVGGGSSS